MLNSTQDITTPRPFLLSVASFMAFGLASLCGLMSLGVVVAALRSPADLSPDSAAGIDPQILLIFLGILYGNLSAGFISIAIGTWRGRWWARNLSITLNSGALICGVNSLMLLVLNRSEFKSLAGPLPEAVDFSFIMALTFAVGSALFVALPSGLLWTYLRKPAQQFFLAKTPAANQREPLSLTAIKVLSTLIVYGSLLTLFVPMDTFLFGIHASGAAATAIELGRVGLALVSLALVFKKRLSGLGILGALEIEAILYAPMAILVHGREHYFAAMSYTNDIGSNPAALNLNSNAAVIIFMVLHTAVALPIFLRAYRHLKNGQSPEASLDHNSRKHSTNFDS